MPFETAEECAEEVLRLRSNLGEVPGIVYVSLGAIETQSDVLAYAVWIHHDETFDASREIASALPVCLIPTGDDDEGATAPKDNPLDKRGNPPVGGYNVGPNSSIRGSLGVIGYLKSPNLANVAFASAAHVFEVGVKKVLSAMAKQPASLSPDDVIAYRDAILVGGVHDIVIWPIERGSRNWAAETKVASIGTITCARPVKIGDRVAKTGRATGRTDGTVTAKLDNFWLVTPTDGSKPISDRSDSGSAWICTDDPDDLSWAGIHTGRPPNPDRTFANKALFVDSTFIATSTGFNIWATG